MLELQICGQSIVSLTGYFQSHTGDFQKQFMKDKLDQAPGMTKRDIRETLHPTLNKDYLPRGNFFVSSL